MHIRWMIRRHMSEVMQIERTSFEHPWFEEEFLKVLRQRNAIGMVCEARDAEGAPVLGYMIYELHKAHLHLLNFAVHPDYRLQGVGTAMLDKLRSKLSNHRRNRISLEIREANLDAHLFFKRQGFLCTGVKYDFYGDSTEDAYLFEYFHDEDWRPAVRLVARIAE